MARNNFQVDESSKRIYVRAVDAAGPYTGGTSANVTCTYTRTGASPVTVTLVAGTVGGVWTDRWFVKMAAGSSVYQFDPPNAAFASPIVDDVIFEFIGPTGTIFDTYTVSLSASAPRAAVSSDVNVTSMAANTMTASALAADAVTEIVAAIFARVYNAKMGSLTFEEITALMACVSLAKASGLPLAPVFRNLADNANAIAATTDGIGNRSAVTLTPGSVR